MRWSALSGVAFVACFATAAGVYGSGAGSSAAEILAYYSSPGNRTRQLVGFAVLLLGALCFLLFVATIRKTPIHDELLGTVAVSCGAATATRTRRSGSPGCVGAVAGLAAAYWYVPTALLLAWVLTASALVARRRARGRRRSRR